MITFVLIFFYTILGPLHSNLRMGNRETWLLPCKNAVSCDYRFFIDQVHENISGSPHTVNHIQVTDFNIVYVLCVFPL